MTTHELAAILLKARNVPLVMAEPAITAWTEFGDAPNQDVFYDVMATMGQGVHRIKNGDAVEEETRVLVIRPAAEPGWCSQAGSLY